MVEPKTKRWLVNLIAPVLFLTIFALFVYGLKELSPNRHDAKLKELQRLSGQIPVFPKFQSVSTQTSSRFLDAGIYNYYTCSAPYEEVEKFYLSLLAKDGWTPVSDKVIDTSRKSKDPARLTFEKGEYRLIVEYAGDPTDRSWNYALSYLWR